MVVAKNIKKTENLTIPEAKAINKHTANFP